MWLVTINDETQISSYMQSQNSFMISIRNNKNNCLINFMIFKLKIMIGPMLCWLVNTSFDFEFILSHLSKGQLSISNTVHIEHLVKVILSYGQLHKCRGKAFGLIKSKTISEIWGMDDYFILVFLSLIFIVSVHGQQVHFNTSIQCLSLKALCRFWAKQGQMWQTLGS